MAKINFNERLAEARQRPAYWIERIVLDFTVALESAMRRKNVSGKELAAKIDVSPAYISKVLSGTPNLTVKSMVRLAHALDLRVALRMEDAATFDLGVDLQWGAQEGAIVVLGSDAAATQDAVMVTRQGHNTCPRRRQWSARPPQMQCGRVTVANRLLAGRGFVDGYERQCDFDEFLLIHAVQSSRGRACRRPSHAPAESPGPDTRDWRRG